jgi:hypothetical protein
VDSGHTVVTRGRLTRELLYVSMTRGRKGNFAYVSENDLLDHDALDPSAQPSWREIIGEVLAAEGAERTAHEVRATELSKADSLERLSAEYDYLAQIAAGEDLAAFLRSRVPERVNDLQQSPSWGAAVTAWRRCAAVSLASAQRHVVEALETCASARDLTSVIHSRLRTFLSSLPSAGLPVPETPRTNRPDLAAMITQVTNRMQRRSDAVVTAALTSETEWKRDLLQSLGPAGLEEANSLIRAVAIFRDRWGLDPSPLPLGPVPADYEWEQKLQRTEIEQLMSQASEQSSAAPQQIGAWLEGRDISDSSLSNVGLQL